MFGFGKETAYLGYSLSELSSVRDILSQNKIKYNIKTINHQGQFLTLGRGTIRGSFGSAGMNMDYEKQYEVLVNKKDYENAKYLLRDIHKKNS